MISTNFRQLASFIWSVAELLRGDFKQSQYGRVILPFTLLRRLECVLEDSKQAVLEKHQELSTQDLPEEAKEKFLFRAANNLAFFNTSPMSLATLGQKDIQANLIKYVQSFSTDAREIFDYFNFNEFVGLLSDANLLYRVVEKFANIDLSPKTISNHDMGLVFEELIRRFAESSNETAGEHFTPRDIVRLTTALVFNEDDDALSIPGIVRTIYDPTAGTGGFLSSGMEYLHELNPQAVMRAFGQELNPESYAICKGDMLIKGQDVSRIKLGNTLSNDQLPYDKFDYMLSNPPFGVDWKKIDKEIKDEHVNKGFNGRFGPGLPRVSDGSLLFLLHLISKMRKPNDESNGSRIGIVLNGSPLFTGNAGSGESEIRRYILEADLLEAIVALPTEMFYNTGIATYVWVLNNRKPETRQGKVQLIDASNLSSRMRKSLGSKRNELTEEEIRAITKVYGDFEEVDNLTPNDDAPEKTLSSKIFENHEFGYRRVTIERPLRLSVQITDEAIASLRFAPRPLDAAMQSIYEQLGVAFGEAWTDDSYGQLGALDSEVRALLKVDFPEIKEANIKKLLDSKTWLDQKVLLEKAQLLQGTIGTEVFNDFNAFDKRLKKALKDTGIKLSARERRQFIDAISWRNPEAAPIIDKVVKEEANPLYGRFSYEGKVVEFIADGDLRDTENIELDPSFSVIDLVSNYVKKEVLPHVPDAWINVDRRDEIDEEVGIVGYEIPFNRHFYVYEAPRSLEEIDADLDAVSREIMQLLQEVHS